jgi:hypothetical protein
MNCSFFAPGKARHLGGLSIFTFAFLAASAADAALPQLKVVGTQVLNDQNQPVRLRGVNCASMEWSSDGEGHILKTVSNAIHEWHVNIIRLPLTQDRWFGKVPEQATVGSAPYRALVRQVVDYCAANNCYVILDLHWSDCNEWGTNIGQHSMPDTNSVEFWKDFAPVYANNPAVLFDLYNEPHDVSWDTWLKGGMITDKPNTRGGGPARTYLCVGMQEMLDTVRATGAKNVVVAGGLDWAYDFSGILAGRQLVDSTGNGVIYANHCYDNKNDSVDTWIAKMEKATATLPVIVSEFGGNSGPSRMNPQDNWLRHVLQAIEDHHWSYTAWDLHPSAGPTLIFNDDPLPPSAPGASITNSDTAVSTMTFTNSAGGTNGLGAGVGAFGARRGRGRVRRDPNLPFTYTPTSNFGVFVKEALDGTLPKYTPTAATPAAVPASP